MASPVSPANYCALRLHPGEDLREALEQWLIRESCTAAAVVTCVGSLQQARLRLADGSTALTFAGPFEIVSLVGTLSPDGVHLHIALAATDGAMRGGHLLVGNTIHTTAEIVLAVLPGLRFRRNEDPVTGYRELTISASD